MKSLDIGEATGSLAEFARNLEGEPLLLTDHGQPIAALMPIDEEDASSIRLGADPRFLALIERARMQHLQGLSRSAEDVRREFALPGGRPADRSPE